MKFTLKATDLAFLRRVDARWKDGARQEAIAAAEGLPLSTLRTRMRELGFGFAREGGLHLETTLGGLWFSRLIDSGGLVAKGSAADSETVTA